MIRSFKAKMTARIADGESPKGFPADLVRSAFRKLRLLNGAEDLRDLASPPGNRLEALGGDRAGQYSIRVNDHWRIFFRWSDKGADDVEIVDYHD